MSQYNDVMNKKAVALKYDENRDVAPVIVASGLGYMAERIVEMANENGVPVYEDNSLATVLTQLDLGTAIPEELYQAIVDIYAYFLRYNPEKAREAREAEEAARAAAAELQDADAESEGEEPEGAEEAGDEAEAQEMAKAVSRQMARGARGTQARNHGAARQAEARAGQSGAARAAEARAGQSGTARAQGTAARQAEARAGQSGAARQTRARK